MEAQISRGIMQQKSLAADESADDCRRKLAIRGGEQQRCDAFVVHDHRAVQGEHDQESRCDNVLREIGHLTLTASSPSTCCRNKVLLSSGKMR